jgi:hypothetical protein
MHHFELLPSGDPLGAEDPEVQGCPRDGVGHGQRVADDLVDRGGVRQPIFAHAAVGTGGEVVGEAAVTRTSEGRVGHVGHEDDIGLVGLHRARRVGQRLRQQRAILGTPVHLSIALGAGQDDELLGRGSRSRREGPVAVDDGQARSTHSQGLEQVASTQFPVVNGLHGGTSPGIGEIGLDAGPPPWENRARMACAVTPRRAPAAGHLQ